MENKYAKHEIDYIRKFESLGYTASFKTEENRIQNLENKKWYGPEDVMLVEEFRFEGMSNPADMSILYAIETKDGAKGTILSPYGAGADGSIVWFLKKVPKENMGKFDKQKFINEMDKEKEE